MALRRIFRDGEVPVADAVADFFMERRGEGCLDLSGTLMVVPTRQAGRRLRYTLARRCHDVGAALLSARTVTPDFIMAQAAGVDAASPLVEKAVWFQLLEREDLSKLSGLFPHEPPERGTPWALSAAAMVQSLREQLLEAGLSIGDVFNQYAAQLEEPDRWADLAKLETKYLKTMHDQGLHDRCENILTYAAKPDTPDDIDCMVIAAVPDLSPLVAKIIEAMDCAVDVIICAPEQEKDAFDAWGRPNPDAWLERTIDMPDPEHNLAVAAGPEQQAEEIVRAVHEAGGGKALHRTALGALDAEVLDALRQALESRGVPAFDPNPVPLSHHRMCLLLQSLCDLVNEDTYTAFSRLMRHPDWLAFACRQANCVSRDVLTQLDEFQNEYLPQSTEYIITKTGRPGVRKAYPALAAVMQVWQMRMQMLLNGHLPEELRKLFEAVYTDRMPKAGASGADETEEAARILNRVFREADETGLFEALSPDRALGLVAAHAAEQHVNPERPPGAVALEGWMELFWNPAPLLAAAGMNEGNVPDTRVSDVFLPDALKSLIGLHGDRARTARDAYMLASMLACRPKGRVLLVCGKTRRTGDPLKPSRLLFHCPDAELPERAKHLFKEVKTDEPAYAPSWNLRLDPSPPEDVNAFRARLESLSVTAFRSYLRCPFRFYLSQVLEMESLGDDKAELDPMDFGTLVHHAWEAFAEDERMLKCTDAEAIRACLTQAVDRWINRYFGHTPPLPVRFARHTAVQRLAAAAEVQAGLAAQGWEMISAEKTYRMEMNGMTIRGRIDRMDRNRNNGQVLVIDYKTSDRGDPPEAVHLSGTTKEIPDYARAERDGKVYRWNDLQLPLYLRLLEADGMDTGRTLPAFFNMPKAATGTDLMIWEGFDASWRESADECARQVVANIQAHRFWPPQNLRARDDYDFLMQFDPPAEVFDTAAFQRYMDGGEGA